MARCSFLIFPRPFRPTPPPVCLASRLCVFGGVSATLDVVIAILAVWRIQGAMDL